MPFQSQVRSRHAKQRFPDYFESIRPSKSESNTKLSHLLGCTAVRIRRYTCGEKVLSPDSAYKFGDGLRTEFGWRTSGIECLWACGYWREVLSIIRHLAITGMGEDVEAAAQLFAWLPRRMLPFERKEIIDRLRVKFEISETILQTHFDLIDQKTSDWGILWVDRDPVTTLSAKLKSDLGSRELEGYCTDNSLGSGRASVHPVFEEDLDDLERACGSDAFRAQLHSAWESYNSGDYDSGESFGKSLGESSAIYRFELHLIDSILQACDLLADAIFPSYAIPRIWRLATQWISGVGNGVYYDHWKELLPWNFR